MKGKAGQVITGTELERARAVTTASFASQYHEQPWQSAELSKLTAHTVLGNVHRSGSKEADSIIVNPIKLSNALRWKDGLLAVQIVAGEHLWGIVGISTEVPEGLSQWGKMPRHQSVTRINEDALDEADLTDVADATDLTGAENKKLNALESNYHVEPARWTSDERVWTSLTTFIQTYAAAEHQHYFNEQSVLHSRASLQRTDQETSKRH